MKTFGLTEIQAEAILNLRLRALRKLEEMEIRGEHTKLMEEREEIQKLLGSTRRQWTVVAGLLKDARAALSPDSELGRRRAGFDVAPDIDLTAALEASKPKEPITAVLSQMGWIRAMKGHGLDISSAKFKDGDALFATAELNTSDKLVLMSSDGRAFTLSADKLPGGRGHGEPIRLSIDLEDSVDIVTMFKLDGERKRLVASDAGYGFIMPESELDSTRKAGKKAVNCAGGSLLICDVVDGDHIAIVGTNKKMLVFPLADLPEMNKGKGVKLQNYRGADKMADAITFTGSDDLTVIDGGGRNRTFPEWRDWLGKRAQAGKVVPRGFPRTGRFRG